MEQTVNKPRCYKEKKLLLAYKLSMEQTFNTDMAYDFWAEWWPEDLQVFAENPAEWDRAFTWVQRYVETHDTTQIERSLYLKRHEQKRKLNKTYGKLGGRVVITKATLKNGKLARYLLMLDGQRRGGNFASLMDYGKKLQELQKTKE